MKDLCAKIVGRVHKEIPRSHTRDVLLGSHIEEHHEISSQLNRLHHMLHLYEELVQHETSLTYNQRYSERILTWVRDRNATHWYHEVCKFEIPSRNVWELDTLHDWMGRTQNNVEHLGTRTLPVTNSLEEPCINPVDALSGK